MKNLVFALLICFWSSQLFAGKGLPANCAYKKQTINDVTVGQVYTAVDKGATAYKENERDDWAAFAKALYDLQNSYDYLRIESPKYVLQGQRFAVKGNLFDPYAYVKFYNSEKGYVGKDKSNLYANSYKDMRFHQTYGYGLTWVRRGSLCSAEGVWVQKRPRINAARAWHSGGKVLVDVNYIVDQYSKASVNKNVPVKITVRLRNEIYGGSESHSFTTGQLKGSKRVSVIPKNGPGLYWVSVSVNDGTFSEGGDGLENVRVPGKPRPPCKTCRPL